MAFQDILPITSIVLIIIGFLIVLFGIIWLAYTISNGQTFQSFSNTDDIIGEMNNMFTYFADQIQQSDKHSVEEKSVTPEINIFQSEYYDQVIKYNSEGLTPEQIAKQLHIGKGEVNLILGISQMR